MKGVATSHSEERQSARIYTTDADRAYLCCNQSPGRTAVSADLHNGGSRVVWRHQLTCTNIVESFRIHTPMYSTIGTIVSGIRQGLEDKCEVAGQGSLATPKDCRLSN